MSDLWKWKFIAYGMTLIIVATPVMQLLRMDIEIPFFMKGFFVFTALIAWTEVGVLAKREGQVLLVDKYRLPIVIIGTLIYLGIAAYICVNFFLKAFSWLTIVWMIVALIPPYMWVNSLIREYRVRRT